MSGTRGEDGAHDHPGAGAQPWLRPGDRVAGELGTDLDHGLADSRGRRAGWSGRPQRDRRGPRRSPPGDEPSTSSAIPLVYLLLVAIVISVVAWLVEGAQGVPSDALVIALILVVNAIIGYVQEAKAETAVAALQRMTAPTALVVRGGVPRIPTSELVVGDLVALGEGDAVGADARLLTRHHPQGRRGLR